MNDIDYEKIDREAIAYLRKNLEPSLVEEYNDDEIYLYMMDQYEDYFAEKGLADEDEESSEGFVLDIEDLAGYFRQGLSADLGINMDEDDAYDMMSTLLDYYAEIGFVDLLDEETGA